MTASASRSNIALIGMAASGKSTLGARIATTLHMTFIDTDQIMERKADKPLRQILEEGGSEAFIEKESVAIRSLDCRNSCISTGGSAVYSVRAMLHLKRMAFIVYLDLSFPNISQRLAETDMNGRGIVMDEGKTLLDVYNERLPLYRKYADCILAADGKSIEGLVAEIIGAYGDVLKREPQ